MALTPLTREQLKQLYEGKEVARQKLIQRTIEGIYNATITSASELSSTSYTYQLSKYSNPSQNKDNILAGVKLLFPDSSVVLVSRTNYDAIVIDWSEV
jgi:hypothetical protein